MKLWIDDMRPKPDGFDAWAKDYQEAVQYIETGRISFVSFDHDLGKDESGYDVACRIEAMAAEGGIAPLDWRVHSANPIGRERIVMAMRGAEKYWTLMRSKRVG
jgi:hypothetical protein